MKTQGTSSRRRPKKANWETAAKAAYHATLDAWMEEIGGQCLWRVPLNNGHLEGWQVGTGRTLIVQRFNPPFGWELYTALGINDADASMADALRRLGFAVKP